MTTRAVLPTHATRPPVPALGAGRRILRAVALAATVPYLALKTAWVAGSHLGIPEGSVLRESGPVVVVANTATLAMDACLIVLVLVLTRPWGMRVPGWLLTVPVFVATGLLTPILIGFPGQMLLRALGFGAGEAVRAAREPFLDPWVFTVVYGGFTVQGLALAGLFVPYARERWGGRGLGAPGRRLPSPTGVVAGAAAALGVVVGAVYLYWAFGGTAGLSAGRIAEYSAEAGVVSAVHGVCASAAGVGAALLARGASHRARWPLALTWIGGSAAAAWGCWMLTMHLGLDFGPTDPPTVMIMLTLAGQTLTGLLAAAVLVRYLGSNRAA
ncbi:hypothetical protein AB0D46_17140 [Streptomyces sp. NPDC048383]|uniref:hypothetical protein n=1 Tax=Streptomyces sp. NPDC048383 TaxID=3155386 RepID=UPI00341B1AB8